MGYHVLSLSLLTFSGFALSLSSGLMGSGTAAGDGGSDGDALRQRLRNMRKKIASNTSRRLSRRSEVFLREPLIGFDASWTAEEAWANGYGSGRELEEGKSG